MGFGFDSSSDGAWEGGLLGLVGGTGDGDEVRGRFELCLFLENTVSVAELTGWKN